MALEQQIVAWSKTRPAWQRAVMRRTAVGDPLSNEDYDQLVEDILAPTARVEDTFGLEHFPKTGTDDPPVRLVSIAEPEHVNALESDQPLTFEANGLTIVYGDNGSGKSGYARLMKRIARARHHEEILSDVFRDTAVAKPSAQLSIRVGDLDQHLTWPDSSPHELRRMLFYDGLCGQDYLAAESDFPYRPSALVVMEGLISACVAVRSRIDAKLDENARSVATLPVVGDGLKTTEVGLFLTQLSGTTSVDALDALITKLDESSETIDGLKSEEARLLSADRSKEQASLLRQAEKLDTLHAHVERLRSAFGNDAMNELQERRNQHTTLQKAARLLARSFESEPLAGVGSSPWKALWESARRFSEELAYPSKAFPAVDVNSRCVLCQQLLAAEGRDRLTRFEEFIKDDTQVRLGEAQRLYDEQAENLTKVLVAPDVVLSSQKDLEATHQELVAEVRTLLDKYEEARQETRDALANSGPLPLTGIESVATLTRLSQAATAARKAAEGLDNPEAVQQRLAAIPSKRRELELLQQIKISREAIVKEIIRRREREALEAAKSAAATGPITNKIKELSEDSITEVVRDAFTRETDRLRLERVTIARTRANRGALLHQPKLVGTRQEAKLPRVFSEGERTALGLAAFFTEAQLDGSKSALILDDPVNSLDHIRRGLVAARVAAFAENRQVVVFTHDVAFVADLKREAGERGVPVAERSVTRSRARGGKPGACTKRHPWKAKDVSARLDELRQDVARIGRECHAWEENTYEDAVAVWAGNLSETWERIFSQEVVGPILAEGGLEVRPMMVKILARFSDQDHREFNASYSRVSQWAKRHDKSDLVNYVPPDVKNLEDELNLVTTWFKRVKGYRA